MMNLREGDMMNVFVRSVVLILMKESLMGITNI